VVAALGLARASLAPWAALAVVSPTVQTAGLLADLRRVRLGLYI